MFVQSRNLFKVIYYGQVLRAYSLALAAGDAGTGFTEALSQGIVGGEIYGPALALQIVAHICVVKAEVFGDADVHRTATCAV